MWKSMAWSVAAAMIVSAVGVEGAWAKAPVVQPQVQAPVAGQITPAAPMKTKFVPAARYTRHRHHRRGATMPAYRTVPNQVGGATQPTITAPNKVTKGAAFSAKPAGKGKAATPTVKGASHHRSTGKHHRATKPSTATT